MIFSYASARAHGISRLRLSETLLRNGTSITLAKRVPRKVRLKDLAAKANVSVATVSMALSDHPSISDATKKRIHQIGRRLGYGREAASRALRFGMLFHGSPAGDGA